MKVGFIYIRVFIYFWTFRNVSAKLGVGFAVETGVGAVVGAAVVGWVWMFYEFDMFDWVLFSYVPDCCSYELILKNVFFLSLQLSFKLT